MPRVISASGLSKRYWVSHTIQGNSPRTLRDTLGDFALHPWRVGGTGIAPREEFWALRDLGFEIEQGETVGLIGRNGAGKSTLLKILSLITRPTTGRLKIVGRVGSLLEVGVGFHAELSGRENIFLSGAVLGMSRRSVARNLEEIAGFAEIGDFLDVPVKRYSSGMLARLGFAVASHLDSEILIVDEALSVGDVAFQNKCAERITKLAEDGRTVLFVSHNMSMLSTLCRRGMLLERGRLTADGKINDVVAAYLKSLPQRASSTGTTSPSSNGRHSEARPDEGAAGAAELHIVGVEVFSDHAHPSAPLCVGSPAQIVIRVSEARAGLSCVLSIHNQAGQVVARFDSSQTGSEDLVDARLGSQFACGFDRLLLVPGRYTVKACLLAQGELRDRAQSASFEVLPGSLQGRSVGFSPQVAFAVPHRWTRPFVS